MNEFHKHLVKKFFPNANYDDLSIGEIKQFIEQIEYVCKAQRNACRRMCEDKLKTTHNPILDIILSAEIRKEDYENN